MRNFSGAKKDAVQYVSDQLDHLNEDSLSIMIMGRGKYEGFFVSSAINLSSDDIVKKMGQACYDQLWNISNGNTQDG